MAALKQRVPPKLKKVEHQDLGRFFDLSLDMLCIAGVDGYFKHVNPAFEALGYSREELLSRPFLDFVHPDDRASTVAEVEKLAKGQPTIYFENRYRRKDGSYRWLQWTSRPDERGTLYAVARDITAAKQNEERLRYLALENARLLQEARTAVKDREEVLAVVSHDLKNPLTTIGIVTQLWKKVPPEDSIRQSEMITRINRSAEQMSSLIAALLDFSKIQSGTLLLDCRAEDLRQVLSRALDSFRVQAEAKRIGLEMSMSPDIPLVLCDRHRIDQVLDNLLSNALKFTPEGGRIRVSATRSDDGVRISVSDTGPGIQPEHLSKIFQRYWQAEKTRGVGSGLGLSIAKGIVEAHGGKIGVESTSGAGATFYFTLPGA